MHMPGNANTRKIDEVENLKFSGVRTENTIECNLLLTLDIWSKASYLIVFVKHLSKKHSILLQSFNICMYPSLYVYTRTSLFYTGKAGVYADNICKSVVTNT